MRYIRLLAIDQAKTTGYAVFDNSVLIEYGTIELGKKTEVYENILFNASQKIGSLMDKVQPNRIAIEDIQQQNQNVTTYKKLAMLMGVLVCLFQGLCVPYEIVPPARWRSYCQIKGKKRVEQKENTLLFVKERFGLENITEDVADAISLGYFAINNIDSIGV